MQLLLVLVQQPSGLIPVRVEPMEKSHKLEPNPVDVLIVLKLLSKWIVVITLIGTM